MRPRHAQGLASRREVAHRSLLPPEMDMRWSRYGRALTPPHWFADYIMPASKREEEVTHPQTSPAQLELVTYDTLLFSTIPQTSPAQLELWSRLSKLAQDR